MKTLYKAQLHRIPRIEDNGKRTHTNFVVVHTAEGENLDGVQNYFATSSPDGVGAHLGIAAGTFRRPQVRQWADLDALVWHAKGANSESVGIELMGFASQKRSTWTRRRGQRIALAETIARLCHYFDLGEPTHKGPGRNVKGHNEIPTGGHWDPGPAFPWDLVIPIAKRRYQKWYGQR